MTGDLGYTSRIVGDTIEIFGDLIIPTDNRCCYTATFQWTDRDNDPNPILWFENFRCITHEEFGNCLSINFSIRNSAPVQFRAEATFYQVDDDDDLPTGIWPAIADLLPPPSIHASIQIITGPALLYEVNISAPNSVAVFQIVD